MHISHTEGDRILKSFTQAIAGVKHRPRGILVSCELLHELKKRNLIQFKPATPGGIPELEAFGSIIPFFNDDIYIHCDPINLPTKEDVHFRLPPEL